MSQLQFILVSKEGYFFACFGCKKLTERTREWEWEWEWEKEQERKREKERELKVNEKIHTIKGDFKSENRIFSFVQLSLQ